MIKIRSFKPDDAATLADVSQEAVRTLSAADYSEAQIRAWRKHLPNAAETLARCGDGRLTLLAEDRDARAVAFIDLEHDGHIDLFYARPHVSGSGVARALYAELEETARERGLDRLYVEASETARRFFEKQGFEVLKRRDFDIQGIAIHNYAMEKRL